MAAWIKDATWYGGILGPAGAWILSLVRGVFAGMRSAWHCVRHAVGLVDYRWALLCHAFLVLP